jgi:tungstate transport system ATP-binding protein
MVSSILPLRLKDVSVAKRGKTLIGPIDLEIGIEGVTIIMGPNGSGKTTLLRLMHGLEPPRQGSLEWNTAMQDARKKQAFVFQTPIVLRRSALDNIIYPLQLQNVPKDEANKAALKGLERVNLLEAQNLNASFLSGGEKQKLAIARALVTNPDIMFLDEPTANLDGASTREIETIIKDAALSGVRIVITTHDIGQGKRLADDVIFLYQGKLHEHGYAKAFFDQTKTQEAVSFLAGEIVE